MRCDRKQAENRREEFPLRFSVRLCYWLMGKRWDPPGQARTLLEQPPERGSRIGICCSGGGIRSAAYNLGALQTLRRTGPDDGGLLKQATYLAAVSGGGYIASSYYTVAARSDGRPLDPPVYDPGSPEEDYLRNRANYLIPDFRGGVVLFLNLLYGLVVNVIVLSLPVIVIAKAVGSLYNAIYPQLEGCAPAAADLPCSVDVPMVWSVSTLALLALGFGLIPGVRFIDRVWGPSTERDDFARAWAFRLVVLGLLVGVVFVALPELLEAIGRIRKSSDRGLFERVLEALALDNPNAGPKQLILFAAGVLSLLGGVVRALTAPGRQILATAVIWVVGPLFVLVPFIALVNGTATTGLNLGTVEVALLLAGSIAWLIGNNLQFSMHHFYRDRLHWAFGIRRLADGRAFRVYLDEPISIHKETRDPDLPTLIVCAAANLSEVAVTPPGRNAASFTFSSEHSGMPSFGEGRRPTEELVTRVGPEVLTLPAATAVSGAAISPSMGKDSRRSVRFLLGLANVRLGMWLPNPLHERHWRKRARKPRLWEGPGPFYLVLELLGVNSLRRRYLYVTDGGHYEVLGLVELLRRGCTDIFCFDASGDPQDAFYNLGEAIEIARTDLNIDVSIDPKPLIGDPETGWSRTDHVLGEIRYPGGEKGTLVYAKATVSASAPWDVKAFRRRDPRFPNHSTIDQFFNEEKFEAYRSLGAHTAARAIGSWRAPWRYVTERWLVDTFPRMKRFIKE
jgi:hypothetical protein